MRHAFKLLFVIAILWLLVSQEAITVESLVGVWRDGAIVGTAMIMLMAANAAMSMRLHLILKAKGYAASLMRLLGITFIGQLIGQVFFGVVGGDAARVAYLGPALGGRHGAAALAVLADRVCGLCGWLFLGAVVIASQSHVLSPLGRTFGSAGTAVLFALSFGVLVMLMYSGRAISIAGQVMARLKLERVSDITFSAARAFQPLQRAPGTLLLVFSLAVVTQILMVAALVLISTQASAAIIPAAAFATGALLGMLSSALPITPAGIGVGEVVFDQVCQLFLEPGVSYGFAGLFLSFRALIALAATPGLVVLILMRRKGSAATAG